MIRLRHLLAALCLAVALLLAWIQSAEAHVPWLGVVSWLSRYETAHIVGHIVIFGGVALLLAQGDRTHPVLVWGSVLAGGMLLEVVQVLASHVSLSMHLLQGSAFDLTVDALGAWIGLRLNQPHAPDRLRLEVHTGINHPRTQR
jgi:hypothetical protein